MLEPLFILMSGTSHTSHLTLSNIGVGAISIISISVFFLSICLCVEGTSTCEGAWGKNLCGALWLWDVRLFLKLHIRRNLESLL